MTTKTPRVRSGETYIYFTPGLPDHDRIIHILDGLTQHGIRRRGVTAYLHLALNKGLAVLRARISALEAEGKTREAILQSFFNDPDFYRVAFLYFEALDGLARARGAAPGAAPTPLVAPTPVAVGVAAESVIPVSDRVIPHEIPEIPPEATPEIAPVIPPVMASREESAPAMPVAPNLKPDWSALRSLTSAGVGKRGEPT